MRSQQDDLTRYAGLRHRVLAPEQERAACVALAAARASGDSREVKRLVDHIVRHNMRMVVSIAHRYAGRGIDLEELVQLGAMGMSRGLETFDVARGLRLSTYCAHWVAQHIRRAVHNEGATIRRPVHVREIGGKIRRASDRVQAATGREATVEELSTMTGAAPAAVRRALASRAVAFTPSLDATVREDGQTFLDITPGEVPDPEAALISRERAEQARELLETLDAREADVLRDRFGDDSLRLVDIGRKLNVSRERARQIQAEALDTLRQRMKWKAARERRA